MLDSSAAALPPAFDGLAEAYDRYRIGYAPQLYEELDEYGLDAGANVLDVASGTGLVASALVARGSRVTGVDISEKMLARARSRTGRRVSERCGGSAAVRRRRVRCGGVRASVSLVRSRSRARRADPRRAARRHCRDLVERVDARRRNPARARRGLARARYFESEASPRRGIRRLRTLGSRGPAPARDPLDRFDAGSRLSRLRTFARPRARSVRRPLRSVSRSVRSASRRDGRFALVYVPAPALPRP
ncbi:MAG: class I SAM-dependent methyltransferase [Candidatus Eremiobacteraeota bacterium]|nr:class I SAM-dependent methyltransferase [Candidatus Eremiobacteraeota bacterium]